MVAIFNIQEYENSLKDNCQFVSVKCNTRTDGYGADTVVKLTDSQMRYFKTFPEIEIKGKLLASHNMASHSLHGWNMCKEPYISINGNVLIFSGSVVAAHAFLMYFFCIKQ